MSFDSTFSNPFINSKSNQKLSSIFIFYLQNLQLTFNLQSTMVEVEEIELDLGLSIGGAFRKPVEKEKSKPELGQNQIQSNAMQKVDQNQQSPVKHESHAFKRKREQKNGTRDSARGFEPVFKKEKTECVNGGTVSVNAPFHVLQLQQFGKVKFAPPINGMQLPCWFGGEKNVGGIDGVSTVNGGDGKVKSLSNGSSSRCSSVVSDYQSSSREGKKKLFYLIYFLLCYLFKIT